MTLELLKDEINYLKNDYLDIYNNAITFSNFLQKKGFGILDIKTSFKSASIYIDYVINDEIITVRYSNHTATGNYGTTDFSYEEIPNANDEYLKLIKDIISER